MEPQRESTPEKRSLKRWKSLESLYMNYENIKDRKELGPWSPKSTLSDSSIHISYIYDSDSKTDCSDDGKPSMEDSGIYDKSCPLDLFQSLEVKIDKLSAIIDDQSSQLAALQDSSGAFVEASAQKHAQIVAEAVANVLAQRLEFPPPGIPEASDRAANSVHEGARALLAALEAQELTAADHQIRTALAQFLQSEELKDLVVSATTSSIQVLVQECVGADVTSSYLPLLERAQKRLLRQATGYLDDAFRQMEAQVSHFSKSTFKTARFIRHLLESHQRRVEACTAAPDKVARDLQNSITGMLEKELKKWREELQVLMKDHSPKVTPASSPHLPWMLPVSPPQPIEPGRSAIEQLMSAAEINNKMKDGDVNGSFERALSAADLVLVMAACRAADPARVFAPPCQLKQHVLLSLVQQLATDMVHDTQLKCRYLEDSIMNLNTEDPIIFQHIKAVIEDVCNHLSLFLKNYPSHMSSRRIKMLVMAAGSLVNKEEHTFNHPISDTYVS